MRIVAIRGKCICYRAISIEIGTQYGIALHNNYHGTCSTWCTFVEVRNNIVGLYVIIFNVQLCCDTYRSFVMRIS